jgi:hypothetical protein
LLLLQDNFANGWHSDLLVDQYGFQGTGDVWLQRQMSGQSQLEKRRANGIGDHNPQVLSLPERGAPFLHNFGSAFEGVVCRRLPIGKLNAFSIGDESAVVQMKMVEGDFSSRGWRGALLSLSHRTLVIGDRRSMLPKCALFKGKRNLAGTCTSFPV